MAHRYITQSHLLPYPMLFTAQPRINIIHNHRDPDHLHRLMDLLCSLGHLRPHNMAHNNSIFRGIDDNEKASIQSELRSRQSKYYH